MTDRAICGAHVWRCPECRKAVSKQRQRAGANCPRHPDVAPVDSQCDRRPVNGGRCYQHGGNTTRAKTAVGRRLLADQARADLARLGVSLETTPLDALEAMLYEAAGNVTVLRSLVADLPEPLTWEQGPQTTKLVAHPLVVLYSEERDRLAKLSEACVKLGLDERRVRVAETHVERFFSAVTAAVGAAEMTAAQATRFKAALAKQIRALNPS